MISEGSCNTEDWRNGLFFKGIPGAQKHQSSFHLYLYEKEQCEHSIKHLIVFQV